MATRTDARGQVLSFTYDALNRLTGISTPAEAPTVFAYDEAGAAYGVGRLTSISHGTRASHYGYDATGRVATVSHTVHGQTFTLAYTYDDAGNLSTLTYPSGRTVAYTRDAAGQITEVASSAGSVPTLIASQIEHAPFGPVTQIQHANGLTEARQQDAAYRTTSITVPGVLARAYGYTDNGNVASIDTQALGYDKLDRLTSATGTYGALAFDYDKTGNRTAETRDGTRNAYTTSTANNWLTKQTAGPVTYTHDAAGNVTDRGADSFTYDAQGRMTGATVAGGTAAYTYNELHQRVAKTVAVATTLYAYGPAGQFLAENGAITTDPVASNHRPLDALAPLRKGPSKAC